MPDISLKPIDNIDIKIQKTEPVVFDDSITLYEFLGKLQNAINELVDNNNQLPEYIAQELQQNFQELYDRVAALEGRANNIEPILNTLVQNVASLTRSFEYTEGVATQHLDDNDQLLDNIQDQIDGIIVGDSLNVGSMTPGTRYMIAQSILNDIKTIINEKLQTPGSEMKPDEMAQKISNIGTQQDSLSLWLEGEDGVGAITNDELTIHARSIRPYAFTQWKNAPKTVTFGQEVQTLYRSCFLNTQRWETLDLTLADQLGDIPIEFAQAQQYDCTLKHVVFGTPKTHILKINSTAFMDTHTLETFDFTKLPNLEEIASQAFWGTGISDIDLSNCTNLQYIRGGAFRYIGVGFSKLVFPTQNPLVVEVEAFANAGGSNVIPTLTIPANVTVQTRGFNNIPAVNIVLNGNDTATVNNYNSYWEAWHGYGGQNKLKKFTCNGKRFLGNNALRGSTALNTVELNDCFGIGGYTLCDCNIKTIHIDHCFCIGERAFSNAFDSLDPPARLKLPADLNKDAVQDTQGNNTPSLSAYVFAGSNVPEIDLSDCVYIDYLPRSTFEESSAVTIKLPPNIKKFLDTANFHQCRSLVNLEIPGSLNEGLTQPENWSNCTNLTNITLGSDFHIDFNFANIPAIMAASAWDTTAANLRDLTGSTAKTLTMTNSQKATMSAATEAAIRAKNWTITTV